MRGVLWSHLLASICGGLVVVGVLLGFGVIGKQHTETVPLNYAATPPATSGSVGDEANTAALYLQNEPGVVSVQAMITQRVTSPFIAGVEPADSTSYGSGFLIATHGGRGYILTAFHIIEGANYSHGVMIAFNAQTRRHAIVVKFSQADDVALLEVSMAGVSAQIHPLKLGNSRQVNVGDNVLALGNPFGHQRTLASGIVSALQPALVGRGGSIDDVIQIDDADAPGASGGPLLDANGSVIGVSSQIEVSSGGANYLAGFAVPINTIVHGFLPVGVL